jgi:hypothetical protein
MSLDMAVSVRQRDTMHFKLLLTEGCVFSYSSTALARYRPTGLRFLVCLIFNADISC